MLSMDAFEESWQDSQFWVCHVFVSFCRQEDGWNELGGFSADERLREMLMREMGI
jgi:hypothetical protein